MALEIRRLGNSRFLAAGELHAGFLERLRDVHQRHALLARRQRRGHPVEDDIGPAAADHLARIDVGSARLDIDVEPEILVEALVLGDVVAGELRLGHPFELQGELVLGLGAHARQRQDGGAGEKR